MRILQLTPAFVPSRMGGIKKFSHVLSKGLTKRGHEVTVYTTDIDDKSSRLLGIQTLENIDGMKVYYFRNLSHWFAANHYLFFPMGMAKVMKREVNDFDILHLHDFRTIQSIIAWYYAKKNKVPYLLQAHGSIPRAFRKKRVKWLFDAVLGHRLLRDASRLLADTEIGVDEAEKAGVERDRIVLLPLLFDDEEFSNLPEFGQFRKKYDIIEKHIITFLGRIHEIKGLDFLVESFAELILHSNDIILVIVGPDAGYKSRLESIIEKLNIGKKVLFTGFLDGAEKFSALLDADVVVQPSRYEQAAWASLEAVMCGTPIIVSKDTGAGEDVKRIDAGYLVKYGDKDDMVKTIRNILNEPAEARAKASKARDYIKANLSLTTRIGDYERIYMECIEENQQKLRKKK